MCQRIDGEIIDKNQNEIEFIESTHEYFVDGRRLPSVSEIMKPLSEQTYLDINPRVLANAAKRGTAVHMAVEMLEMLGVYSPDEEIRQIVQNYKVAKKLKKFEPIYQEIRLTNREFCGTLDMIAEMDGKIVIIDLKNTSKINHDLLAVQLQAYRELCEFNGIEIQGLYCLQLKKDGYKFVEVRGNEFLWNDLKKDYFMRLKNETPQAE